MTKSSSVDPVLAERIRRMPKAEIHVHLEGAQLPETIWALAQKNGVRLPAASLEEWKRFYEFRDFDHFIQVYIACSRCMKTARDFADMTEDFHRYQASQNILYTEAFLSASLFVDTIPHDELIAALTEACARGRERYGVEVRFIPDIARNFPQSQQRVLEFTLAGHRAGLFIGLGLGGIERGFPPEMFTEVYAAAREAGLHLVAHGGETTDAASVRGAVESLHAERIGHGIRSIDDPDTMRILRERGIPMEVCPVSNYQTGAVPRSEKHPIFRMIDEGLFCTLNSDDPPMFSTSLTNEYLFLAGEGMSWEQLWQLNRNTLEASFLDGAGKTRLREVWNSFATELS